jgi:oligopeptide transport system permease protein
MFRFTIARVISGGVVVFIVATLTFFILRLVPGGPFDQEKVFPPEIKKNIQAKYHLDRPLGIQYWLYMKDLVRLRFGPSFKYRNRQVEDILRHTFPVSMVLGLWALFLAAFIGVSAGIVSAVWRDTVLDRSSILMATLGISLPNFVIGALLILLFSHLLKVLPPALWEDWRHLVLPAVTLGAAPAAYLARLMRSSMLEVLDRDYIRTARAKGLSRGVIIMKHGLKNSLGPLITVTGPLTAMLITGSFIVEKIFSVPGMGRYFITAVTNRDYPLVMGVTIVYAVLIVVMNFLVDVLYTVIDPRVRLGR